jgi:protocatechuate 3,4-dioxygenase beta subunit
MTDTATNSNDAAGRAKTVQHQLDLTREYLSREDVQAQLALYFASHGGEPIEGAMPSDVDGPFFVDQTPVRSDMTEGRPGLPLELRFTVLDLAGNPLEDATVTLWHCDPLGYYSGYLDTSPDEWVATSTPEGVTAVEWDPPASDDSRFLRGEQSVDKQGVAAFKTVYPGWYFGRAIHIHIKVQVGGENFWTSQLYLPEEWNEFVEKLPPYNEHVTLDRLTNDVESRLQLPGFHDMIVDLEPITPGKPELGLTGSFTLSLTRS